MAQDPITTMCLEIILHKALMAHKVIIHKAQELLDKVKVTIHTDASTKCSVFVP